MANKNKATHLGQCQCCGRTQKLPDDKLSKHGYTVDFGYFSGICRGSGYLPFESSCDQVERYIREAEEVLTRFKMDIALWSAPSLELGKVWFHEYDRRRGMYRWRYVDITCAEHTTGTGSFSWLTFTYVDHEGKTQRFPEYGTYSSVADFVNARNLDYVKRELQPRAASIERYIDWQVRRVQEWKSVPLTPVRPEVRL